MLSTASLLAIDRNLPLLVGHATSIILLYYVYRTRDGLLKRNAEKGGQQDLGQAVSIGPNLKNRRCCRKKMLLFSPRSVVYLSIVGELRPPNIDNLQPHEGKTESAFSTVLLKSLLPVVDR